MRSRTQKASEPELVAELLSPWRAPMSYLSPRFRFRDLGGLLPIFVFGPLIALALVVGAELIPDEKVATALLEAGDAGPMSGENRTRTWLDTPSDRWTECNALTMGLGDGDLDSPVASALHSRSFGRCALAKDRLQAYDDGGQLLADTQYYRYWWADTAILRPSVVWLGLPATRALSQLVLGAAFLALLTTWSKRIGFLASLAFLGPIVVATDFLALYEALPQAISLTIALVTARSVLIGAERCTRPSELVVVGAAAGAVLQPFDLMISIPVALTLCVVSSMLVEFQRHPDVRPLLKSAAATGFGWWVGYAWLWAAKWAFISALVGPTEVIDNIRGTVEYRINGELVTGSTAFMDGSWTNLDFWIQKHFAATGLAFEAVVLALAVVVAILRQPRPAPRGRSRAKVLAIGSASLIPFAWYEFASNHSQIHNWIMFRAVAVSLGIVAGASVLAIQSTRRVLAIQPTRSIGTSARSTARQKASAL